MPSIFQKVSEYSGTYDIKVTSDYKAIWVVNTTTK